MRVVASLFLLIVGASAQSLRGSGSAPAPPPSRRLLDAQETTALKTMFDMADTNKDGLVSFPELLMMYPTAPAAALPAAPAPVVAPPVLAAPAVAVPAVAAPAVAAPA
eukprot:CAMPEP_0119494632 /NCGR_PEP_ID=MMETSP1344-20130328/18520_1 /TAXON_ID=236787 /ORGANISM="Florenciella parvula, Strain CCMP2471" /LENGTH=107 /DNA_ID=CAMNT_0007530149 /DNA_START=85 /DNA_END=404 /DNA_ORIENTATION=+